MNEMREALLEGVLLYPGTKVLEKFPEQEKDILAFWKAIWHNYLRKQETNGLYWYERLSCKVYNHVVRTLSHHKWIVSHSLSGRRWASVELNEDKLLELVTADELSHIRAEKQYQKYLLDCVESKAVTLVRQNGTTKRTGLFRKGFCDAGNSQFGYDMKSLGKYETAAKLNLVKSMDKIKQQYPQMKSDEASYDTVCAGIYDWHASNEHEAFTTGDSISDSRGRAISQSLRKVFNPISSKDARASLVIPSWVYEN